MRKNEIKFLNRKTFYYKGRLASTLLIFACISADYFVFLNDKKTNLKNKNRKIYNKLTATVKS